MLAGRMRMAAGAGGTPWHLSGGAPTPIAVYNLKAAASQAASYVNIVNPGTYNLTPGTAPAWNATDGLVFTAGSLHYLDTGLVPAADSWTYIIRFSGASVSGAVLFGFLDANKRTYIQNDVSSSVVYANASGATIVSPELASGVLGMTGSAGYRNGVSEGVIGDWSNGTALTLYLGALHRSTGATNHLTGSIQNFAIYSTSVDSAIWVPAVSAAVAAL